MIRIVLFDDLHCVAVVIVAQIFFFYYFVCKLFIITVTISVANCHAHTLLTLSDIKYTHKKESTEGIPEIQMESRKYPNS